MTRELRFPTAALMRSRGKKTRLRAGGRSRATETFSGLITTSIDIRGQAQT